LILYFFCSLNFIDNRLVDRLQTQIVTVRSRKLIIEKCLNQFAIYKLVYLVNIVLKSQMVIT